MIKLFHIQLLLGFDFSYKNILVLGVMSNHYLQIGLHRSRKCITCPIHSQTRHKPSWKKFHTAIINASSDKDPKANGQFFFQVHLNAVNQLYLFSCSLSCEFVFAFPLPKSARVSLVSWLETTLCVILHSYTAMPV